MSKTRVVQVRSTELGADGAWIGWFDMLATGTTARTVAWFGNFTFVKHDHPIYRQSHHRHCQRANHALRLEQDHRRIGLRAWPLV